MALALGAHFSAALTERGGLLVFGGARFRPRVLGGVGPVEGDAIGALTGGLEALALAGGEPAPVPDDGLAQDFGAAPAEGQGHALAVPAPHPFADEALVMVAAGDRHFCALTGSGAVWVWGSNDNGQLGTGDDAAVNPPARWPAAACGGAAVAMVACGENLTFALTAAGEVWACGEGGTGQNGSAAGTDRHTPRRVRGLAGIAMVAVGEGICAALGRAGEVWIWGNGHNEYEPVDENGDPTAPPHVPLQTAPESFGGSLAQFVATGTEYWGVVTARGELWMCGEGEHGRLGCGDVLDRDEPTLVGGAGPSAWGGARVRMVSCGPRHAAAVTDAGAVWTWGEGRLFKLGHGDEDDRYAPAQIAPEAFGGSRMVLVAAKENMTMALTAEGFLYAWGAGLLGRDVPDGGPGADNASSARAPVPVEESFWPGTRVARSCGLRRRHVMAFCAGTHARLGAAAEAGGGGCEYRDAPAEIFPLIEEQSRRLTGAYARMSEGLLRLLAVRERRD